MYAPSPPSDPASVLSEDIKEYHFHIYFFQASPVQSAAALALRDSILRLRRDGVFVAVPLHRVNHGPMGPHVVGSYEVWVPKESFADVFGYLAMNRGELSILVHPLTREERIDHSQRNAWLGPPIPLNLDVLTEVLKEIPSQYTSLGLGYSSTVPSLSLEERQLRGAELEELLKGESEAAPAPPGRRNRV